MVTAQELYGRSRSSVVVTAQQRTQQKEAEQQAEQEWRATEEGKRYIAQQERLKELSGLRSSLEQQGYTQEKSGEYTIFSAPPTEVRTRDESRSYSPKQYTFKDGTLVSEKEYVGYVHKGTTFVNLLYERQYKDPFEYTEKKYKIVGASAKLMFERDIREGVVTRDEEYDVSKFSMPGKADPVTGRWIPKSPTSNYKETEEYQVMNPEQKKVYEQSQLKKGILTPEQEKLAPSLTNQEQIRRWGRVIVKTKDETGGVRRQAPYTIETASGKAPLTKKQYTNILNTPQEEIKEYSISFVGGATTKLSPEVAERFDKAIKGEQVKESFNILDTISQGGIPEGYEYVTPKPQWLENTERVAKIVGGNNGTTNNPLSIGRNILSSVILSGSTYVGTLLQQGKKTRTELMGGEIQTGNAYGNKIVLPKITSVEYKESFKTGVMAIPNFFISAAKGIPKTYEIGLELNKQNINALKFGLDTIGRKTTPEQVKIFAKSYEESRQASLKKIDSDVGATLTLGGFAALGAVAPVVGSAVGGTIFGLQATKTIVNPSGENIGTTISFAAIPAASGLLKGGKYVAKNVNIKDINGTKTLFFRLGNKIGRGYGWKSNSGKTAVVLYRGEPVRQSINPNQIGLIYPLAVQPTRYSPKQIRGQLQIDYNPSFKYMKDSFGHQQDLDAAIKFFPNERYRPINDFVLFESRSKGESIEPLSVQLLRKSEAKRELKTNLFDLRVEEARRGLRPLTSIPAKGRKIIRKEIIGKRSLTPLVIPESLFSIIETKKQNTPLTLFKPKESKVESKRIFFTGIVEEARRGLRPLTSIPAKGRKIIRKEIIGKRSLTPLVIPESLFSIIETKKQNTPLTLFKQIESKKEMKRRIALGRMEEVRLNLIPITSIPSRDRRVIRRELKKGLVINKDQERIVYDIPETKQKKIKKIFTIRDIVKQQEPQGGRMTSGGLILITKQETKTETPTIQITQTKQATKSKQRFKLLQGYRQQYVGKSQYAYGGMKYEESQSAYSTYEEPTQSTTPTQALASRSGSKSLLSFGYLSGLGSRSKSAQASMNVQRLAQLSAQSSILGSQSAQVSRQAQASAQMSAQSTAQASMVGSISLSASAQEKASESLLRSRTIQRQRQELKQRQREEKIGKTIIDLPEPSKSNRNNIFGEMNRIQAYEVLIKQKQLKEAKGRYKSRGYVKANEQPLTKEAALGLGASIVDTYANRSFTIRKVKGTPQANLDYEAKARALLYRFTQAKKNREVFVEKAKYAISSQEERNAIPYEAQRQKRAVSIGFMASKGRVKYQNKVSKRGLKWL